MTLPLSVLNRILDALPPGSAPSLVEDLDPEGNVIHLHFDPKCAGDIERMWPEVFDLCAECGCDVQLESIDRLETRAVLTTRSAAPDFSTEQECRIVLTLRKQVVEEREAA
jgi:hypothetical protein